MSEKNSLKEEYENAHKEVKENIERENGPGKPIYQRIGILPSWIIVIGAFCTGGILSIAFVPGNNWLSFLVVSGVIAFPFWALCTKSGIEWVNSHEPPQKKSNNSQSVNMKKPSPSDKICSNCGWKNPKTNNFCHDCGVEL